MTRVAASPTVALRGLDLAPGTIALWWLGQAGFAVRAGGLVLLVDPFLAPMAERASAPAFDPEDAIGVDVVMCSHEHYDHLDLASLPTIARASSYRVLSSTRSPRRECPERGSLERSPTSASASMG